MLSIIVLFAEMMFQILSCKGSGIQNAAPNAPWPPQGEFVGHYPTTISPCGGRGALMENCLEELFNNPVSSLK